MLKEEFTMPKTFKDGEVGFVPSVMLGGPFDRKRYKRPILPNRANPDGTAYPLTEPYQISAHAHYPASPDATHTRLDNS